MAGQPRSIRIEDDLYTALIQEVARRRADGEDIDITKLINQCIRLQIPIPIWHKLNDDVNELKERVKRLED